MSISRKNTDSSYSHQSAQNAGAGSGSLPIRLACGAVAGILGTCVIYPLDIIKTRVQCTAGTKDIRQVITHMWQLNGLTGFYRGLPANLLGIAPEKAIKLAVNDSVREILASSTIFGSPSKCPDALPVAGGMIAGASAGLCQVIVTCPLEATKIQLQMEAAHRPGLSRESLLHLVKRMGPRNLYRGVAATLMRDVSFSVTFFPLHAWLKERWPSSAKDSNPARAANSQTAKPLWWVFTSGVLAGCTAASLVTPADVIKTRIQAEPSGRKSKIADCFRRIIRNEGPRALFKGAIQRCLIISPLFGISLLIYEAQKTFLAPQNTH